MQESPQKRLGAALAGLALSAIVLTGIWFVFGRAGRWLDSRQRPPVAPSSSEPAPPPARPAGAGPPAPVLNRSLPGQIEIDWLPPATAGEEPQRLGFRFDETLFGAIPRFEKRLERFLALVQGDRFAEAQGVLGGLLDEAGPDARAQLAGLQRVFLRSWGVRLLSLGNPAQAILVLLDLEKLAPDEPTHEQYLGLAYYAVGERGRAYEYLSRAAKNHGLSAAFAYELGELLYYRNDIDEARTVLAAALKGPRAAQARTLLDQIGREYTVEGRFREIVGNEKGHFRIVFDGTQNAQAAYESRVILEQARRDVGRTMHFRPSDRIAVVLYTRVQYNLALNAPDWSGALYDGKIRLPTGGLGSSALPLRDTIYHEYAHAVIQRMGGKGVPAWLHEGLAQLLEPASRSYRFDDYNQKHHEPVPISYLERGFGRFSAAQARMAYAAAQSFVGYLVRHHGGWGRIGRLLEGLKRGLAPPEALERTYGLTQASLETRWRRALERSRR